MVTYVPSFEGTRRLLRHLVEHALAVMCPINRLVRLGLHLAAAVADEDGRIGLPDPFEAEIVVDAAVGEDDLRRVRRLVQRRA